MPRLRRPDLRLSQEENCLGIPQNRLDGDGRMRRNLFGRRDVWVRERRDRVTPLTMLTASMLTHKDMSTRARTHASSHTNERVNK